MKLSLLDLPPELIIQLLSYLPHTCILRCRLTHPFLLKLIDNSAHLQYIIELAASGFENNPSPTCKLVIGDRLRLLKTQEQAWINLNFAKTVKIETKPKPSSIYDLTGGIFLLGETTESGPDTTEALNLTHLPSKDDDFNEKERDEARSYLPNPWWTIDLKTNCKLVDVGLAVHEHDLIAVVTYS